MDRGAASFCGTRAISDCNQSIHKSFFIERLLWIPRVAFRVRLSENASSGSAKSWWDVIEAFIS